MDPQVRREVVFAETPEEVWRALTEPARLEEWFANDVELTPERGGCGVFRWDDGSVRLATVDDVIPQRRFVFRWHEEGRDDEATRVELLLDEAPEGTRLTVVETAPAGLRASALAGEWSWGVELLAALPRIHRLARVAA